MRGIFSLMAALVLLVIVVPFALAQAIEHERSPALLVDIWAIVQPVVVLLVSTVGPVLVAWIAARLASLLKIADENQRKDLELKFSAALHQSALNGLKFALSRTGIAMPALLDIRSNVVRDAIEYVRSKNPDALDAFKLDDSQLAQVIISKAPDVLATLAQGAK